MPAQASKLAFIATGPESSGTRLLTRILMEAGAAGSDGHVQPWDATIPTDDVIVWRRSLPHGGRWPDLNAMADQLEGLGYLVAGIGIIRERQATLRSQLAAGHITTLEQGAQNMHRALRALQEFRRLELLISYEALVHYSAPTILSVLMLPMTVPNVAYAQSIAEALGIESQANDRRYKQWQEQVLAT